MRYAQNGKKHGGSDDWRTLRRVYENLHRKFTFTVDSAASEENALHPNYWTAETDGLVQNWSGLTALQEFLAKTSDADCSVMIVPAQTQATYFLFQS